jgi:hypothetical protein
MRRTCFIYIPGHNSLESESSIREDNHLYSFVEELKKVRTGGNLSILIQVNHQQNREVARYQVLDGEIQCIQALQAIRVGEAESLKSFLKWGLEQYPAEHAILILWNHGHAWNIDEFPFEPPYRHLFPYKAVTRAVFLSTVKTILTQPELIEATSVDEHAGIRDFLDTLELEKALKGFSTPLEILSLDGCLPNLLETLYQIRDTIRFVVGLEDIDWQRSWMHGKLFEAMSDKPDLSPEDLIRTWISQYRETQKPGNVLSLIDLNHLPAVVDSVDNLAAVLKTRLSDKYDALSMIRGGVQGFSDPNHVDLYDLGTLLMSIENQSPDIKTRSEKLLTSVRSLVVEASNKDEKHPVNGICVFFPQNERVFTHACHAYQKLDFASASPNWIKFLAAYVTFKPSKRIQRIEI